MLQYSPLSDRGVVAMQPGRTPRRPQLSGPTTALLAMSFVLLSGLALGLISPSHPAHAISAPQPFDHFPR